MSREIIYVPVFALGYLAAIPFTRLQKALETQPIPNALMSDVVSDEVCYRVICLTEGRGRIDLKAMNKKENARGPAQIRPGYLQDANEWRAAHGMCQYTHMEMHDYDKALETCKAYWARYHLYNLEQRCRAHAGGPDGPRQVETIGYWEKCQEYI